MFIGDAVTFAGKAASGLYFVYFSFLIFVHPASSLAVEGRTPPTDIPIESWLQGPDRTDFGWKVEVGQPYLTFRQRYQVSVVARFRADSLYKGGLAAADLHFVTKFAAEDGRWLPGQSYSQYASPPKLAAGDLIHWISSVYAKPGTYRIAVMAYDRLHRKGNLWRGTVHIAPINQDQLPGSDANLPAVEFLLPSLPITGGAGLLMLRDPWDFGRGSLTFPLRNDVPVEVDIVANLSLSDITKRRHSEAPDWLYQMNAANVTEISRVISEMDLKSGGCIRFSALDIPRQDLFVDGVDAHGFDWSDIKATLQARERSKIDVHTLAGEKRTPSFLTSYLTKLAGDPPHCKTQAAKTPVRVLVVVGDNFTFPYGTEMVHMRPSDAWARCYYVELVPIAGPRWDEVGTLLKSLNPVRLEASTPAGFRKVLAQMIRDIEKLSKNPAVRQTSN